MGIPKNELIAKLEKISALYQDTVAIRSRMDNFNPDDCYERQIAVPLFPGDYKSEEERTAWQETIGHDEEDAIEIMEMAYERVISPKEPAKPNVGNKPTNAHEAANALKKKLGWLLPVAGFVAICVLISGGLFSGEFLTIIGNLLILAACVAAVVFFFMKHKSAKQSDEETTKQKIKTYENNKQEAEKKYRQDMDAYKNEYSAYLLSKSDFIEEYTSWREVYLAHLKEEDEIAEKLEADRIAEVNKIHEEQYVPAQNKLEEANDLITEKYLPVLHIITDYIKSGRADDLKEAVNLYEETVYRERQLQLQREQEERRRYEEEQRRADEERRHREEMQFREDQERRRRREEEKRRADEDRRLREETLAREAESRRLKYAEKEQRRKEDYKNSMAELEKQNKLLKAAQAQCRACANAGRCNMMAYNKTPNCTGFTPRR